MSDPLEITIVPMPSDVHVDAGTIFVAGGGASVHNDLGGRDTADAHPMSAVTGLEDRLAALAGGAVTFTALFTVAAPADGTAAMVDLVNPDPTAAAAGQVPAGWSSYAQIPVSYLVTGRVVRVTGPLEGELVDIAAQPDPWTHVPVAYGQVVGTGQGILFVGGDAFISPSADMPLHLSAISAGQVFLLPDDGGAAGELNAWANGIHARVGAAEDSIGDLHDHDVTLDGRAAALEGRATALELTAVTGPQIAGPLPPAVAAKVGPVAATAVWRIDAARETDSTVHDRVGTADGTAANFSGPCAAQQAQPDPVLVVGGNASDGAFVTPPLGDFTGGVDIRVDVTPGWSTSAELVTQTHDGGMGGWDNLEAALYTHDGALYAYLEWTEIGGSIEAHNFFGGPIVALVDHRYPRIGLRFTLAFDNGAGKYRVAVERAAEPYETADSTCADGSRWVLVRDELGAGTTSIDTGVGEDMSIGRNGGGGTIIHSLEVFDGVDGTRIVAVDPRAAATPRTFIDGEGNVWTSELGWAGPWRDPAWIASTIDIADTATLDLSGDFTLAVDATLAAQRYGNPWATKTAVALDDHGAGLVWHLSDGTVHIDVPVPGGGTPDVRHVHTLAVDRTAKTATAYTDADVGTPVDITTLGSVDTADPLQFTNQTILHRAAFFPGAFTVADHLALADEWRPTGRDPAGLYRPGDPGDWTSPPYNVADALDELARRAASARSTVVVGPGSLYAAVNTAAVLWTSVAGAQRPGAWVIPDATSTYLGVELAEHVPPDWEAFDVALRWFQITAVDPTSKRVNMSWDHAILRTGGTVPTESPYTWVQGAALPQYPPAAATNVIAEWELANGLPAPTADALMPARIPFRRSDAGDTLDAGTFGVVGLVLRQVDGTDDPTATTALADIHDSLAADDADIDVVIISDSTADYDVAGKDWPLRLLRRITARHPATTTRSRIWNPSSWGSYATVTTGTGSHTLSAHCACVGGWSSVDAASALSGFAADVTSPDAVFISLGFNDSTDEATFATNYQALVDAVIAQWPGTPIVLCAQWADLGNSHQTMRRTVVQSIAAAGHGFIDLWTEMGGVNSATGHYSGNQHPTPGGSEKIAGRVFGAIR